MARRIEGYIKGHSKRVMNVAVHRLVEVALTVREKGRHSAVLMSAEKYGEAGSSTGVLMLQ